MAPAEPGPTQSSERAATRPRHLPHAGPLAASDTTPGRRPETIPGHRPRAVWHSGDMGPSRPPHPRAGFRARAPFLVLGRIFGVTIAMSRLSLRATGREVGCDHSHLARLVKAGRLRRGDDGLVDVEEARAALAGSDPAMRRKHRAQVEPTLVTRSAGSPRAHRSESPQPVTTPDDARAAVRLIEQVLADEGVASTGPVDFPAARLAETILKARDRSLRIAERKKALVPIAAVKSHISAAFVALRRQIQQMPARHVAEMAAKLGCDAGALHAELDRMIHGTLDEMSAPNPRS